MLNPKLVTRNAPRPKNFNRSDIRNDLIQNWPNISVITPYLLKINMIIKLICNFDGKSNNNLLLILVIIRFTIKLQISFIIILIFNRYDEGKSR